MDLRNEIYAQIQLRRRAHRRRHAWHRLVTALGCVVIFVTTYALILPAITLESTPEAYCGQEEHQHDDSCWEIPGEPARTELSCDVSIHRHTEDCCDESGTLLCTQGDYLVHQHDSFCFDASGELICTLSEQDLHEHDESCYDEAGQLICGKHTPLRHQHTADCMITIPATEPQGLLCTLPEHTHTEACFVQESDSQVDDEMSDTEDDGLPEGSEEETEDDDFSGLLESLDGKHMEDLTQEEYQALWDLVQAEMSEEELAQLSEEDISALMQQAFISLGGLPDEEEEDDLSDKSLLEMTGAELASLTDSEITARTEEFLALTDEEFDSLNLRMAQTENETISNDALFANVSADELMLLGLGNGMNVQTSSVGLDGTITITDDVSNTGCYIASYSGGTEGVTFKWYRSDAGGTESAATRKYYRVGGAVTSNISGDSLENLNLALDGGGITSSRSSVTYRAVLCVDGTETEIAATITNTTHQGELLNGSFETPDLAEYDFQEFVPEGTAGLYWKTTADNEETGSSVYGGGTSQIGRHYIEIIDTSTAAHKSDADTWHSQGTASDGTQYAEINAGSNGALYQTVITTPGLTMSWQVDHMARTKSGSTRYDGTDSMYVVIMDTTKAAPLAGDTTKVLAVAQALASGQTTVDGVDYSGASATLCESVSAWTRTNTGSNWRPSYTYTNSCTWQTHSGTYTVPAGQYRTTYFFVAASTASGDHNIGNHIDNVWFSLETPTPTENDAKLELSKNVYGDLDETALNELLYSLKFNLIRDSDNTVLRTVYAYELGSWSKQEDGSWQLSRTISITDLHGETIRVEEAGYALEGFEVKTESAAEPFTVAESQSYAATFSNTYTAPNCKLTITKHISGSDTSGTFEISASYQYGTETITKSFELGNNGSGVLSDIPSGVLVTISEPNHDGYTVRITDSAGTVLTDSDWYSFSITEDTEIHIYNTAGVILPQTGGTSSYLFIYGGLLLMLSAVVTESVLRRKWGKEGSE